MVEACALTILPLQTAVISVTSIALKVCTSALTLFESVSPSHAIRKKSDNNTTKAFVIFLILIVSFIL